jgi:cytochrome c553
VALNGSVKVVMAVTLAILLLGIAASLAGVAAAQPTEDEAREVFQKLGCISCHMQGGSAKPFDEIVSLFQQWGGQYATIDEAVQKEVKYFGGQTFDNYDQLMETMAMNVGRTMDDPDIQLLYDFFLNLFESSAGTPTATATTTPTGTTGQTTTTTNAATTPTTGATEITTTEAGGPGIGIIAASGVVVALILIGISYILSKK